MQRAIRTELPPHQRGNVLFLILIAVALFAALSFVVTQATRTGSGDSAEKDQLIVSEILNAVSGLTVAIQRMTMTGVALSDISFDNDVWLKTDGTPVFPTGSNPNCTSNRCLIFHPEGGGAIPYTIPTSYFSDGAYSIVPGVPNVHMFRVIGIGTDATDMIIHFGTLPHRLCLAMNRRLKIGASDSLPADPTNEGGTSVPYDGDLDTVTGIVGNDAPELAGQTIFGYKTGVNTPNCRISAVLVPR